jgi:hypothetical protein
MSGDPDPKVKKTRRRKDDEPRVTRGPKKLRRIVNRLPLLSKLLAERECRQCGKPASDPHHLLLRSQGGDDVEENIIPLCRRDHDLVHAWDADTRIELGGKIHDDEIAYVVGKLGFDGASVYFMWHWRRMIPRTFDPGYKPEEAADAVT